MGRDFGERAYQENMRQDFAKQAGAWLAAYRDELPGHGAHSTLVELSYLFESYIGDLPEVTEDDFIL